MYTFQDAENGLQSLVVLRGLLKDSAVHAFLMLLKGRDLPMAERVRLYAEFVYEIYQAGGDWSGHLLGLALSDENLYVSCRAAARELPSYLECAFSGELSDLQEISRMDPERVRGELHYAGRLAGYETREIDFARAYRERLLHVGEKGYGIFAAHSMFLLREGELVPVRHPDPVGLGSLSGYARERGMVVANTRALLEGKPAANVLLYGDSGTGKSTCVKAVANEYLDSGLRLIELRKDQLFRIPELIDRLSGNPLKFILFIDDLSFSKNDGNFSALKAMLEGSIAAKAANMVVYATSNRRHLVKESFSERDGDDIHRRDTLEEIASLSDRFGLTVTFLRPDRDLYLEIAESYCGQFGIPWGTGLLKRAEAYALNCGGRSARTARHFAESLAAAESLQ